ncbi:hypothetical protein SAMN05216249_11727 [Acetitomaculum ruminis DSM 5522]|uniref:Uncharacterized protein n=1 Tax=Acetitomaculum ruminis DSM 5522 TaxID=1120918 RepID=A0A1I0ZRV4_9FIRM|nr:hypothetical protein [Acetitomaculum ruminis]SFB28464.1 hypothetical protein SAMN05216249_11727 [Acetitomaculum ruminis DSM 5522]
MKKKVLMKRVAFLLMVLTFIFTGVKWLSDDFSMTLEASQTVNISLNADRIDAVYNGKERTFEDLGGTVNIRTNKGKVITDANVNYTYYTNYDSDKKQKVECPLGAGNYTVIASVKSDKYVGNSKPVSFKIKTATTTLASTPEVYVRYSGKAVKLDDIENLSLVFANQYGEEIKGITIGDYIFCKYDEKSQNHVGAVIEAPKEAGRYIIAMSVLPTYNYSYATAQTVLVIKE